MAGPVGVPFAALDRVGPQPFLHVGDLAVEIEGSSCDDGGGRHLAGNRLDDGCSGIERAETVLQLAQDVGPVIADEVGLGDHEAVGDGGLLHGLLVRVERRASVDGVDDRHHAVDRVAEGEIRVVEHARAGSAPGRPARSSR